MDIGGLRTDYERSGLAEQDLDPSPAKQIERWIADALSANHPEPTAMTLATIDADGSPSARVVLLRGIDVRGVTFFTNYDSDKGKAIAAHPRASAVLFWPLLQRQLRITGPIAKVERGESEAYFASRPRESQLGAWASPQSTPIAGREAIDASLAAVRARFGDGPIPCPPHWGGYRLALDVVELWQGRPSRLHDRLRYTRTGEQAFRVERLAP